MLKFSSVLFGNLIFMLYFFHSIAASEVIWHDSDKILHITKINSIKNPIFKNLQLCYECEFAPITLTSMTPSGEYDQDDLASHWSNTYDLFIFYVDTIPAGFAVINFGSMIQPKEEIHDIGEFYITPIFRKKGYGTLFAQALFKQYLGSWEIRQLPELEKTSRVFWHSVIQSMDNIDFYEIVNHPQWPGYVQCFTMK